MVDKKNYSERDICTKYITPAIKSGGWNTQTQLLEEVSFTDGKIHVRGKLTRRGTRKRADYILYYKPNIPIAIVEAKDNSHSVGAGMQQALDYARILDIPFVFSSNGDGFIFHDKTCTDGSVEKELDNNSFPSPEELWRKYKAYKNIVSPEAHKIIEQDYFVDGSGRTPRYYQQNAINRSIEAVANDQKRILLVMATGTGKTYTAFQIVYRLWKARKKKRILFLADRTALIDQTRRGDFKHFKDKMTVIKKTLIQHPDGKEELVSNNKRGIDNADKAYEVFLGLYQGLTNSDGVEDAYKDFSPDFFDLIVIDECHRGSAKDDSAWRAILNYFSNATHIGLTATPRETNEVSNSEYFGDPIYTYSLKQGIDDGFLAPYRVLRVNLNVDADGYRPERGKTDKDGNEIVDRVYNRRDFDRKLVIDERTQTVAAKVTEFLKGYDRFAKTIIFCTDIDHAERIRREIVNLNADLVAENDKYVMRITGDNDEGKRELDNFINPEERYPVITTTSELMTTGVDAQTCKLIVLDAEIHSMTKFKQIVGRGTRINEEFGKRYFTILDFRNVTDLFADEEFDGDPIRVKPMGEDDDLGTVVDDEEQDDTPIIDEITGEEVEIKPEIRQPYPNDESEADKVNERRPKQYINGVEVSVLNTREVYFDSEGKPITVSLKDFTREIIKGKYASLDDFLRQWNSSDKKTTLIKELDEQGVMVEALLDAVGRECDLFDLICHVAYDQPPLTRKERANNVKKRNYFTKYGEQARKVLESLLDKYADEGVSNIESMDVLRVQPFTEIGSPTEIIRKFGNRTKYLEAVKELENELYNAGA